jgi:hypothetical protein
MDGAAEWAEGGGAPKRTTVATEVPTRIAITSRNRDDREISIMAFSPGLRERVPRTFPDLGCQPHERRYPSFA